MKHTASCDALAGEKTQLDLLVGCLLGDLAEREQGRDVRMHHRSDSQ